MQLREEKKTMRGKQFLAWLLCLCLCLSMFPMTVFAEETEVGETEDLSVVETAGVSDETDSDSPSDEEPGAGESDDGIQGELTGEETQTETESQSGMEAGTSDGTEEQSGTKTEASEGSEVESDPNIGTGGATGENTRASDLEEGDPVEEATGTEGDPIQGGSSSGDGSGETRTDDPENSVKVSFQLQPENMELLVYFRDEQGEKVMLQPEEDGSYRLLPGTYFYSAYAEGYEAQEVIEFFVSEGAPEKTVTVELQKTDSEPAEVGDDPSEPVTGSGSCGQNLTWTLDEAGLLTISGTGWMYSYYPSYNPVENTYTSTAPWGTEIKRVIIESGARSIESYVFYGCSSLKEITIPDSVTSIGNSAFDGCSSLKEITIPDNVTSIGNSAFYGCSSLTSITIPDNVTSISNSLFYGCSGLTSITIPNSVTSIGSSAFYGCSSLKEITIPDNVTSISNSLFYGCSGLERVTIPAGIKYIDNSAFYECSRLTSITIPDNVTSIGNAVFYGCSSLTEVVIPDGVTSVGSSLFKGCSRLTGITIPDSVTSIGASVFYGCSGLTSITIPNSVTSIGSSAFSGCSSLERVTIPDGVKRIESSAFYGCSSLAEVVIPNSVTSIGDSAFYGCSSVGSIVIPNSVTSIDWGAFYGCSGITVLSMPVMNRTLADLFEGAQFGLKEVIITGGSRIPSSFANNCKNLTTVTLPESVTTIAGAAFSGCSGLTEITIPNGVTKIEYSAFTGCSGLTEITIPDGVTSIGGSAFSGCSSVGSIVVPDGVTSIENDTFSGCSGLTNITLPDSITSIRNSAFSDCSSLTEIVIPEHVTSIGWDAFSGCSSLIKITMPIPGEAYSSALPISVKEVIITSGSSIPSNFFNNCKGLTNITIPESVTTIKEAAFYGCSSLTEIKIPNSVTSIENSAFSGCSSLTGVIIPGSVVSIGAQAFSACIGLTGVEIGDGVTTIGADAFYGCKNLTRIEIGSGIQRVGRYAFSDCSSLSVVNIHDVSSWCETTFENCEANPLFYSKKLFVNGTEVTHLVIPKGTERIGEMAFYNCNELISVEIGDGVTEICSSAFNNCSSLASIRFPDTLAAVGDHAFYPCTGLSRLDFPAALESIGSYAFARDRYYDNNSSTKLTRITLASGSRLNSIGAYAFAGQNRLSDFPFPEGLETVQERAFTNCGLVRAELPDSLTELGAGVFYENNLLKNVRISEGITLLPDEIFQNCYALASVVLPDCLTEIGDYAFAYSGLEQIEFPENLETVGSHAFERCPLQNLNLKNIRTIGDYAFAYFGEGRGGPPSNATVSLDLSGVTSLGRYAFSYGERTPGNYYSYGAAFQVVLNPAFSEIPEGLFQGAILTGISVPQNITRIGYAAFRNCRISAFPFPDSLRYIDDFAFSGSLLVRIEFPESLSEIGISAFQACPSLRTAVLPDTVDYIGVYAFADCPNLTLYGTAGSEAEYYAGTESIPFKSVTEVPPALTGLKLDKESITFNPRQSNMETITVSPIPENADLDEIEWTTSDRNTAVPMIPFGEGTYREINGTTSERTVYVSARQMGGEAVIMASSSGFSASCIVTFPATLNGITLPANVLVQEGGEELISIHPLPERAELKPKEVTWKSSNPKVLVIEPSGDYNASAILTGIKTGTSVITVTADNMVARTTVKVVPTQVETLEIFADGSSELLNDSEWVLPFEASRKYTLSAVKTPEAAAAKLQWSSSAPSVATVGTTGILTLKSPGVTTVRVTAADETRASGSFLLRVLAVKPNLSAAKLSVNSYLSEGPTLSVNLQQDTILERADLFVKDGKNWIEPQDLILEDLGSGSFAVSAKKQFKKNYSAMIRASVYHTVLDESFEYDLPLTLSVINTAPKVKITLQKVNTYYPDGSFSVTPVVTNGAWSSYELSESCANPYFVLDSQGNLALTAEAKEALSKNAKAVINKQPLIFDVYCEGGRTDAPITVSVKPAVTYAEPKVKLGSLRFNAFYRDLKVPVPLNVSNGELEAVWQEDNTSEYFDLDPDSLTLTLNDAGMTAYAENPKRVNSSLIRLGVKLKDVETEFSVSAKPAVSVTAPKLMLMDPETGKQLKALTFNPFIGHTDVNVIVYDKSLKMAVPVSDIQAGHPALTGDSAFIRPGFVRIQLDPEQGKPTKTALTLSADNWARSAQLKVSIQYEKQPAVSFDQDGKLDLLQRESSYVFCVPKLQNCTGAEVFDIELVSVQNAKGEDLTEQIPFSFHYDADLSKAILQAVPGVQLEKKKYTLTVSATLEYAGIQNDILSKIVVTPIQSTLQLKVPNTKISIARGSSMGFSISTVPSGAVLSDLSCVSTLPTGLHVSTSNNVTGSSVVRVTADSSARPGTYTLKFKASARGAAPGTKQAALSVKITVI